MRPLLIVELIGSVVCGGKNKSIAGFHNPPLKCHGQIFAAVAFVRVGIRNIRRLRRLRLCSRGA